MTAVRSGSNCSMYPWQIRRVKGKRGRVAVRRHGSTNRVGTLSATEIGLDQSKESEIEVQYEKATEIERPITKKKA